MTSSLKFRVAELERKLPRVLMPGKICAVDTQKALARVKIDKNETAFLPWFARMAGPTIEWSPPQIGEQVMVLSPDGGISSGYILCGLYQNDFRPPENSDEVIAIHTQDQAAFRYDSAGKLEILLPSGATIRVVADGGITIEGNVVIQGTLDVQGDITGHAEVSDSKASMSQDRTIYNSHHHGGPLTAQTQ